MPPGMNGAFGPGLGGMQNMVNVSTPHRRVALMRHALVCFLNPLDVGWYVATLLLMAIYSTVYHSVWYVPNPSPAVFLTSKNERNTLQGVASPDLCLTKAKMNQFDACTGEDLLLRK